MLLDEEVDDLAFDEIMLDVGESLFDMLKFPKPFVKEVPEILLSLQFCDILFTWSCPNVSLCNSCLCTLSWPRFVVEIIYKYTLCGSAKTVPSLV